MTRREARILAMTILYTADFNGISIDNASKMVLEYEEESVNVFLAIVKKHENEAMELINNSLVDYSISRLNLVDKAIIKLATSELLEGKTEKTIIINEALEITKEYSDHGDHKAVSFNNRLLDTISKNISK